MSRFYKKFSLKQEYNKHTWADGYTYENYKDEILSSYKLAMQYFNLCIEEITEEYIITSTPLYKCTLLDIWKADRFSIEKYRLAVLELLSFLNKNSLFHGDFELRNICIDDNNRLKLIDFETLSRDDSWRDFIPLEFK
jgi:serine/threonine protein kinase